MWLKFNPKIEKVSMDKVDTLKLGMPSNLPLVVNTMVAAFKESNTAETSWSNESTVNNKCKVFLTKLISVV